MAEIKSTMDLVMEKLARMDMKTDEKGVDEDFLAKEGMRLTAAYMRGDSVDIKEAIASKAKDELKYFMRGAVDAFLHNIVLPRGEDQQKTAEKSMQGLLEIGGANRDLLRIFGDIKKILDQYMKQREEYRKHLKEAFRQQMDHLERNIASQTGMAVKMDPAQHPKFQEEWQRIVDDLNSQYGKAIEQYKEFIRQSVH